MKYFTSKKLIIEVSERELELMERAAGYAAELWFKRAEDTKNNTETRELRLSISRDYSELQQQIAQLTTNLPF